MLAMSAAVLPRRLGCLRNVFYLPSFRLPEKMVCGLSRRQNVKKQFFLSAVSPAVNFVDRLSDLPMLKDTFFVFPKRQK